jgi:outer membrane protein
MKTRHLFVVLVAVACGLAAAPATTTAAPKVGLVNFKKIIELSSLGKQEQEMYENMKKQIEKVLTDKEKEFNDLTKKLQDEDFKESQSADALKKMQDNYRQLGQELAQGQSQYYQAMQQANYRILQRVAEVVAKASETVAGTKGLDLVLNDDNAFYHAASLDITQDVISEMDRISKEEVEKNAKAEPAKEGEPAKLDLTK